MAYPTGAELKAFAQSYGITVSDSIDVNRLAGAAAKEFERRTGWIPFLSSGSNETKQFDSPNKGQDGWPIWGKIGPILKLDIGLVSATSVTVGISTSNPAGTVLTADIDYRLLPLNASGSGAPYTEIEFFSTQNSLLWTATRSSIKVIGQWGYSLTLPDDAADAILRLGLLKLVETKGQAVLTGPTEIKAADESVSYAKIGELGEALKKSAGQTILNYTRVI